MSSAHGYMLPKFDRLASDNFYFVPIHCPIPDLAFYHYNLTGLPITI